MVAFIQGRSSTENDFGSGYQWEQEETKTVLHRDGVGNAVLIAVYRDSVRGAFYLASLYHVDPDWGNLAA